MNIFTGQIENWDGWGEIFQSIPAFAPLVDHILQKEGLPAARVENLTPGTNAVFRAGGVVVKIFAPAESGVDQTPDLQTELFAAVRSEKIGVSAPKMVAHGSIEDKYRFAYMVTEYIEGAELAGALNTMTDAEKTAVGRKLRSVTDKMNTPCEPFNGIDVLRDQGRFRRWDPYSERFRAERLAYIQTHHYGDSVFVHGDLCGDNILLTPRGGLYIIDFADAVLAPAVYEHALVAAELFGFDPAPLRGYFGGCTAGELTDICFNGLLIHDFGGDITARRVGGPAEITSLDILRERLYAMIERK